MNGTDIPTVHGGRVKSLDVVIVALVEFIRSGRWSAARFRFNEPQNPPASAAPESVALGHCGRDVDLAIVVS